MTEWGIYSVWNFLTWHIHCSMRIMLLSISHLAYFTWQSLVGCFTTRSQTGKFTVIFPEEQKVCLTLLLLLAFCLFVCLFWRCLFFLYFFFLSFFLWLFLGFALEKTVSGGWALKHIICISLAQQGLRKVLYFLGVKCMNKSHNVFWSSGKACLQHFCLERFSIACSLQVGATLSQSNINVVHFHWCRRGTVFLK